MFISLSIISLYLYVSPSSIFLITSSLLMHFKATLWPKILASITFLSKCSLTDQFVDCELLHRDDIFPGLSLLDSGRFKLINVLFEFVNLVFELTKHGELLFDVLCTIRSLLLLPWGRWVLYGYSKVCQLGSSFPLGIFFLQFWV